MYSGNPLDACSLACEERKKQRDIRFLKKKKTEIGFPPHYVVNPVSRLSLSSNINRTWSDKFYIYTPQANPSLPGGLPLLVEARPHGLVERIMGRDGE